MNDFNFIDEIEKKLGKSSLEQLGFICKDINLYYAIDKTEFGKSLVGKEMDQAGRWLFNHRFGGGHLWWKELSERPVNQWGDVLEHLSSDFFTMAGVPYIIDGSMIKENKDLLRLYSSSKSHENWAMINGFEFFGGASSLFISIYDATHMKNGYTSDLAFGLDGFFVALNVAGGIATSNPLLIISAVVKSTTILRKLNTFNLSDGSSPFDINTKDLLGLRSKHDLNVNEMLGFKYAYTSQVNTLIKKSSYFDFMYNENMIKF